MKSSKYSYKLRPGYSSKELLLDFNANQLPDQLQQDLITILENNGFKLDGVSDLWVNDELQFKYKSNNGLVILSRDIWDFFFIIGENNQADILELDKLLLNNPLFKKLEVDFSRYK